MARRRSAGGRRRGSTGRPRPFVLILLPIVLGLVLLILWGFLTPIILAVLLAMLAAPVYGWLKNLLGGRANVSALLVVLGTFLVIVLPVSAILFLLFTQGAKLIQEFAGQVEEGTLGGILDIPIFDRLQTLIEQSLPEASLHGVSIADQLANVADSAVEYLVNNGVAIFGDIADTVAKFFILLFLLFYLVRDGAGMLDRLTELLPLREAQTGRIFAKIRGVTRAVVFGSLAIAGIQGALGGVGLWIVGLPGLVWGTLIGVSSLIPVVGTALVTVPAIAWLVLNAMYWQAIFFAAWATVLVGGVDNYLRPFLMGGQARMSPFYIFLAIIGGLATFGLSGLIFGPLIIAIAIVVVEIYREEYRGAPRAVDGSQTVAGRPRSVAAGNGRPGWRVRRALRSQAGSGRETRRVRLSRRDPESDDRDE